MKSGSERPDAPVRIAIGHHRRGGTWSVLLGGSTYEKVTAYNVAVNPKYLHRIMSCVLIDVRPGMY